MSNQFNKPPGKPEKLDITVKVAHPDEWEDCQRLRILSVTGSEEEKEKMGVTPELLNSILNAPEDVWRAETNSKTMFSVLARDGAKAFGLGRAIELEKGFWKIRNAFVEKEYRGLGTQAKMTAVRLQEIIIKRGGTKAMTWIEIDNLPSIRSNEKFGFKVARIEDGGYTMELDLTDPAVIKKINEILDK